MKHVFGMGATGITLAVPQHAPLYCADRTVDAQSLQFV